MRKKTRVLIRHERHTRYLRCHRSREPRSEVGERLNAYVWHIGRLECVESGGDDGVVLGGRDVAQDAELVAEWFTDGSVDGGVKSSDGRPKGVYAEVLVEVVGVVEGDTFEAFKVGCKFVELGEATAALLLDAELDLTDPATLKFDALVYDFLLQATQGKYGYEIRTTILK